MDLSYGFCLELLRRKGDTIVSPSNFHLVNDQIPLNQQVMNKLSRPHGRNAHTRTHTRVFVPSLFDIFEDSLTLEIELPKKKIIVDIYTCHFLHDNMSWSVYIDEYSNAGTSKCYDAWNFRISGVMIDGKYSSYGLQCYAQHPLYNSLETKILIIKIDGCEIFSNSEQTEPQKFDADECETKITHAIKLIKSFTVNRNAVIAFSGGKDSVVLSYLAKEANIKIPLVYNNTTIDPIGTLPFVEHCGAVIQRNKKSFLDLIEEKGFPTMFRRFCCKELKEKFIAPYIMTGVRKSESVKRNKLNCSFEDDYKFTAKLYSHRLHPMIYFTGADVEYIVNTRSLECHPLYYDDDGNFCVDRRLGCIGCPLQGDRGVSDYLSHPNLLLQVIRRGIIFHKRMGRKPFHAYLNLVYNLFYSNHGYQKYVQTYKGLFYNDPKAFLEDKFNIKIPAKYE